MSEATAGPTAEPLEVKQDPAPAALPALKGRLHFLDGLRGLAALSVVLFHLGPAGPFKAQFHAMLPSFVFTAAMKGFLGVQLFFVLSGFVIAMSLGTVRVTAPYFGRFMLRRSLRLDPPFWFTIALMLGLNYLSQRAIHSDEHPVPPIGTILANMFYVAKLVNQPLILDVFWTLCLEIQFYLVFVLLTGVAQRLPGGDRRALGWRSVGMGVIFVPLLIAALCDWVGWFRLHDGFFLHYWAMFFLGAVVFWAISGAIHHGWAVAMIVLCLASQFARPSDEMFAATLFASIIYGVGLLGGLNTWLNFRWVQFLGAISYSMYLIHNVTGNRVLTIGKRYLHGHDSLAVVWFIIGIAMTLVTAYLMYRLIEKPSMAFAHRFKLKPAKLENPKNDAPNENVSANAPAVHA